MIGKRKSQSALAYHLFPTSSRLPLVGQIGVIFVIALVGVMLKMINAKSIAPGRRFGRSAKIAIILFQLLLGRMRLWIASWISTYMEWLAKAPTPYATSRLSHQ